MDSSVRGKFESPHSLVLASPEKHSVRGIVDEDSDDGRDRLQRLGCYIILSLINTERPQYSTLNRPKAIEGI